MADTPALPLSLIPSNPGLDSVIRSVIIAVSAGLTTMALTWLNSKGFATTDLTFLGVTVSPSVLIGGAIFSGVAGLAGAVWGWLKGTRVGKAIADTQLTGVRAGIAVQASVTATAPIAAPGNITHADAAAIVAGGGLSPRSQN